MQPLPYLRRLLNQDAIGRRVVLLVKIAGLNQVFEEHV